MSSKFQEELLIAAEDWAVCTGEWAVREGMNCDDVKIAEVRCFKAEKRLRALVARAFHDECPLCQKWDCIGCDG